MTSPNIKSIFTHRHVKYFIPCLFLGLCVVFLYPSTSLHETDIVIPVDYRQIPAGLAVTRPPITGVEVRINGPKAKIKALSDLKLRYELDLSAVNIGLNFVPIDQDQIQLPILMQSFPMNGTSMLME